MPLPKAVQEASDRADQLVNRQSGTPAPAAPVAEKSSTEAPTPAPMPAPEEVLRPAVMDAPEPQGYEHRYKVLQGKYNAEVPRLQAQNKELSREVESLKAQLEQLKTTVETKVSAPASQIAVSDEERERYGEDFVDFVGRIAKSVSSTTQQVATEPGELASRVDRSEELALAALKRQFINDLTARVPNWEQLNTDSGFLEWLDELDPMSGKKRIELFDDAYSRLDLNRVSSFFTSYGGKVSAVPNKEEQVTPRSMRGPSDVPQGKRIWTSAQISAFYNDVRARRISPEDAAVIEKEIFAAQNEGRVR